MNCSITSNAFIFFTIESSNVLKKSMQEAILLNKNLDLFWGAMDVDIEWIQKYFRHCDKCEPEIFISPFNTSDAVFYHIISANPE